MLDLTYSQSMLMLLHRGSFHESATCIDNPCNIWGQSRKFRFSKIDSQVPKTSQATQTTSHNIHYRDKRWAKKLCYSNVESLGFDWHPVLIGVEGSEQTAHVGQVSSVSTTLRKICLSKNYSKDVNEPVKQTKIIEFGQANLEKLCCYNRVWNQIKWLAETVKVTCQTLSQQVCKSREKICLSIGFCWVVDLLWSDFWRNTCLESGPFCAFL